MATVRPARLDDVPVLCDLINGYADDDLMLSRSRGELYESIRDFLVVETDGMIAGCVATHVVNLRFAECKSLAVAEAVKGQGLGRVLVDACLDECRRLGVAKLFALTYQVAFFERLGFRKVDRSILPEKVWGECVRCNKFLDCDEVAVSRDVETL